MKTFFASVLALVIAVALAVVFITPVRQRVAPYLPAKIAQLLPGDAAGNGNTGKAKTGGADKAGGAGKRGGGAIAVVAATAAVANVPLIERTFGQIQSPAVATINARIASQVTEVHVKDGQMVKAGDLLVVLDDRVLQAQLAKDKAQMAKDQALAMSAQLDAQRASQLAQRQAGPQQTADQAKATAQAALATVDSDKAAIQADEAQLTFTRITAPISGRLGIVAVNVGDLVGGSGNNSSASTGMMTITEMEPLKVSFRLPERVLEPIRKALADATPVTVRVKRSGSDQVLDEGQLDFIDSSIDTGSGTIAMSARMPNNGSHLWPGQFGDVEVIYGKLVNTVVVPTVAIQAGQSGPFVWLVKPDNTVEARNVKVARTEAAQTAVGEGLVVGDKVVVEGQLRLKTGAPVTVAAGSAKPAAVADEQAQQ